MSEVNFGQNIDLLLKLKEYKTMIVQRNRHIIPQIDMLIKMTDALNVSLDRLMGRHNKDAFIDDIQLVNKYLMDYPEDIQYLIGLWHLRDKRAYASNDFA